MLARLVLPMIERVTLSIDGGEAVDVSESVVGLPLTGAGELAFSREIAGLTEDNELCVTVVATEAGGVGETSVTECVTVNTNAAPEVEAGADRVVTEGELVGLSGSGSDPDGDALSYRWTIEAAEGPALVIPEAVLPAAVVQALDDGIYVVTLTVSDGEEESTDELVLTVLDDAPIVSVEVSGATEGGVALVTASFTEEGVVDTHTAVVDWGDGTVETVAISAQGTGWGSLFASHVYEGVGDWVVSVTVTDDDGGSGSASGIAGITPVMAVYATATASDALRWWGGAGRIEGLVHSNGGVQVVGAPKSVVGGLEHVGTASIGSEHTVSPAATVGTVGTAPISWSFADYQPGGAAAVAAGSDYHDMTTSCSSRGTGWIASGALAAGIYYAECDIRVAGVVGDVTLVSGLDVIFAQPGGARGMRPYVDGLLALANDDIEVSGANGAYLGHLQAGDSIAVSGARNRFYCGITAGWVNLSGANLLVEGHDCTAPERTTAAVTLMPSLGVELVNAVDEANPAVTVASTVTVENEGALLLVPTVVGLQNHGLNPVTVTGGEVVLEVLEVGETDWVELPVAANTVVRASVRGGVSGPEDAFAGTIVEGESLASWAAEVQVAGERLCEDVVTKILPHIVGEVAKPEGVFQLPGSSLALYQSGVMRSIALLGVRPTDERVAPLRELG